VLEVTQKMYRNLWPFSFAAILIFSGAVHTFAQTPAKQSAAARVAQQIMAVPGRRPAVSPFDLLVTHATIVTMNSERRIIDDGFVAVKGDAISLVGASSDFPKGVIAKQTIDAKGTLVLPGLINGHTHAPMTLLRGLKDDVTLDVWLKNYIFPAEAKNVTEDFVRWGTRLAAAEMIRGGATTFADMYYFEDTIAEETKAAGMRGILGESWLDFPVPDNKNEAEAAAYTEKFLKRWQGDPLIHAAVAPHSIYLCSQKTLHHVQALAQKYHSPILIHVAEIKKELDDSLAQNRATPVQYMNRIGLLGPDIIAAHCVWVDETDRKLLAEKGVGCVHNPSSNMMLASGVAPVVEERNAGVAVGLGTDGPSGSNNDLDLMEEMDLAAKLQKITKMDPRALGAKAVVEMATIEGARAVHLEKEIGSLEPGKKADLILINLNEPNALPMYDVYSQLAYALKASDVETVIIGGRLVMKDRKLLTLHEDEILAKAREYGKKVEASLK
jgi:5-methylthioadenosine/S-adenosylhomocysteine deaminase